MAVKQGASRIARDKIKLQLLVTARRHHILDDTGRRLAGNASELADISRSAASGSVGQSRPVLDLHARDE